MENESIQLSIDDCFKAFDQSFNRLKYFSCLTTHLDIGGFPIDWSIKNPSGIQYMINAPVTQEEKQRLLDGYRHFIHCYVVRDCIESFAISLDRLLFVLLLNGKKILSTQTLQESLSKNEKELLLKFENAGLSSREGKLQLLKKHFDLELTDDNKEIILGLRDIRNCFSHSNGFIRSTDGKEDGNKKRKFAWKTIFIFAKGKESGKEFDVEFNKPMPESGTICIRIQNHEKSFKIGGQLFFTPAEAYEIAFSLQQVGKNFIQEISQKLNVTKEKAA